MKIFGNQTMKFFKPELVEFLVLVDAATGIYAAETLVEVYENDLTYDGKPWTNDLIELDESANISLNDLMDYGTLEISVNDELWAVEWREGDIIAVNPLAEWSDSLEDYKLVSDNETEYKVGSHFLSAIFNGDVSGLEELDIEAFDIWEKQETENIENWHYSTRNEHLEFTRCEITGLMGDCYIISIVNLGE